jgi:Tfp pilus assembly protein PilN
MVIGGVAVLVLAGWQAFDSARLDAERVSVGRSLAQLKAPLAEHSRLVREADDRRARAALSEALSAPLIPLLDLVGVLSDESTDGVVLLELRHRAHETELRGTAKDHSASAEWLKELAAVRGAKGSELGELHRTVATGSRRDAPPTDREVDFTARLRWTDPSGGAKHPSLSTNASSIPSRSNRGEK